MLAFQKLSMQVVVSLGGSIVASPEVNLKYIERYAQMVKRLYREGVVLHTVVGGGNIARKYIEAARIFGAPEEFCDYLGILATRLNAGVLSAALENYARVPESVEDVTQNTPVVMGGTVPGHTTDAVAAMVAEHVGAELLINATNVSGVYSKDPRVYTDARLMSKINIKELKKLVGEEHRAGMSTVLDPKAVRIIERARIRTIVLNGRDLENLERAIKGEEFKGTEIEI